MQRRARQPAATRAQPGLPAASSPLSILHYSTADRFFNCGSICEPADQVQADGTTMVSREDDWKDTLGSAKAVIGQLFAADDEGLQGESPASRIALFHNTTGAVQRVLLTVARLLGHRDVSLLTSDFEYPGCIAALDDQWNGPIVMAAVSRYQFAGADAARATSQALKHAFLMASPRVVYLSHVSRYTGYVLPDDVLRFIREVNPRCVIVLDGAQAAGNIFVGRQTLSLVDYYIASGQKWLGGLPTLGIVWARDGAARVEDYAQALALDTGSGGTANLGALQSLLRSVPDLAGEGAARLKLIELHNRRLAAHFTLRVRSSRLLRSCLDPVDVGNLSGIVGCRIRDPRFIAAAEKHDIGPYGKEARVTFVSSERWIRSEGRLPWFVVRDALAREPAIERSDVAHAFVPMPTHSLLRTCFHLFHDVGSVDGLVERLEHAVKQELGSPARPAGSFPKPYVRPGGPSPARPGLRRNSHD